MRYLLVLFLSGCSLGLSVHSTEFDNPEIQLDTLLGVARIEHKGFFCEHVSAITQTEQGGGFNHCGYMVRLK
jgi:hypothetical protein